MKKHLPILLSILFGVNSWAQDTSSDLYLYYPLDGNAVNAVSVGTFDGSVVGALPVEGYDGSANSAYSFDGINDQILFGDIDLTTESFTISFWIKLPDVAAGSNSYRIMSQRSTCSIGNFFDIAFSNSTTSGYTIGMEMYGGASNISGHVSTGSLDNPLEWNHIAFVKDNDSQRSRVYVNGILRSTEIWTIPSGQQFSLNSTAQFGISNSPCLGANAQARFFSGSLDEIRFHKRALSQTDITSLVPFSLDHTFPKSNATLASVTSGIRLFFTRELNETTLNTTNITVSAETSGSLTPTITSLGSGQVFLDFEGGMPAGEVITITMSGIQSSDAQTITAETFSFNTATGEESVAAYYPFDGDLIDKTPDAINLQVNGVGQSYGSNIYRDRLSAVSITGSTYLYTGTNSNPRLKFGLYEDFTISLWIKPQFTNTEQPIINQFGPADVRLYLEADGHLVFKLVDGNNSMTLRGEETYFDGFWHHVTVTADRNGEYQLYVDGVQQASANTSFPYNLKNTQAYYYGTRLGSNLFYRGLLDELTFYNRHMSATEVNNLVPLRISANPVDGDIAIEADTKFKFEFNKNIDVDITIANHDNLFSITGATSGTKTYSLIHDARKIEVVLDEPFILDEEVTLTYSGIQLENGQSLSATYNFETGDVDKGMLFHYTFDGDANNAVADTLNGTVTNATLTDGFDGTANSAYNFDGNAKIEVGQLNLDLESFTMAFWMRRNDTNQRLEIAGQRDRCSGGPWVEISSPYNPYNGKYEVTITLGENEGSFSATYVRAEIEPFEWAHITVQRDAQKNKIRIYRNAELIQEADFLGSYSIYNAKAFELGSGNACVGVDGRLAYNGDLDEVRFYLRALDQEEISKLVAFKLEQSFPEDQSTAFSETSSIILDFNRQIDPSSVTTNSVNISAAGGAELDYSVEVRGDSLVFIPDSSWPQGKLLSVAVSSIKSTDNETLSKTISFTVANPEQSLLLHLPFDGTIEDMGANGFTLNATTLIENSDRFRVAGKSIGFNGGSSNYLQIPTTEDVDQLSFGIHEDFSISTWFKTITTNRSQIIYLRYASPNTYVVKNQAWLDTQGNLSFTIDDGLGVSQTVSTSGTNYGDAKWHHVTFSVDRDGQTSIIIDGLTAASESSISVNADVTGMVHIGNNQLGTNLEYWRGQLDDFRIHNRAFTQQQVSSFAPMYIAAFPEDGYDAVSLNETFEIEFQRPITAASAVAEAFTLTGSTSGEIAVTVTGGGSRNIFIDPATDFAVDEEITLTYTGLTYSNGTTLADRTFHFESADINKGMLVYYPFNGDASNQASDNFNGTITGATLIDDRNAGSNSAYSFGGSDFIDVGKLPLNTQSFTVAFWIKRDDVQEVQLVAGQRATCNASNQVNIGCSWDATNTRYNIGMSLGNTSLNGSFQTASVAAPISVNTWTHVTMIRDNSAGMLKLYMDGNLEAVQTFNTALDVSNAASFGIATGSACVGVDATRRFTGDLDEFRVYNRAITAEEAAALPSLSPAAPSILTTIQDITMEEDANELLVADLSSVFSSNDDLDYTASSSNADIQVRLSGTNLYVVPTENFFGTADITVSAFNGIRTEQTFAVTVNAINDAPAFSLSQSSLTVTKNFADTKTIYVQAMSPENESDQTITYSIDPVSVSFANIAFDTSTGLLTITSIADEVGEQILSITANDGQVVNNTYSQTFALSIVDNIAPTLIASIEDVTMDEDGSLVAVEDLSTIFSDENGDALEYTVTSDTSGVIPSVVNGAIQIDLESDYNGTATITVIASDGIASVSDVFAVTVNPVNDEPVVANAIADQTATEDVFYTFQLAYDIFNDVDGDNITISEVSIIGLNEINGSWLTYNASNHTISGTPRQANVGDTEVTVTATDGTFSVSDDFVVTVVNVNDAPTYTSFAYVSIEEDGAPVTRDFTSIFIDEDGDNLTYSFEILETTIIIDATMTDGLLNISPLSNLSGTQTIRVSANDGLVSTSLDLGVTINAVNDLPVVNNAPADQIINENDAFSFTLPTDYFTDVESTATIQSVVITGQGETNSSWLSYDENSMTLSGTPAQENVGITIVTVTATDGTGTTSDAFLITVNNVNDAPYVANQLSLSLTEDQGAFAFDLNTVFADGDEEVLTYSFVSDAASIALNSELISASINGNILTVTPLTDANGNTSIQIQAADALSAISYNLPVAIAPVNDAPVFNVNFSDTFINENDSYSINVSESWYSDVDEDELTVTMSASESWLTYDATTMTLAGTSSAENVGFTLVSLTVSDGIETITTSYYIEVLNVNEAPNEIELSHTSIEENIQGIQTVGTITGIDPDQGDVLTFSLPIIEGVINDNADFSITVNNDVYELQFKGTADFEVKSSYSISLMAVDLEGATFTKNFTILVNDSAEPLGFEDAKLTIYPNPTTATLNIDFEDRTINYEIINLEGKVLKQGDGKSIDVRSLKSGTYLLIIQTNDQKQVVRFIKD